MLLTQTNKHTYNWSIGFGWLGWFDWLGWVCLGLVGLDGFDWVWVWFGVGLVWLDWSGWFRWLDWSGRVGCWSSRPGRATTSSALAGEEMTLADPLRRLWVLAR